MLNSKHVILRCFKNIIKQIKIKIRIMSKIKLNLLHEQQMSKRAKAYVKGGEGCTQACCCACAYENNGGSSTKDNSNANYGGGLRSPECSENVYVQ